MKKNSLSVYLLFLCYLCYSQSPPLLWAKNMGGSNAETVAGSLEYDSNGNVYITGTFFGTTDFDPGLGVYNLTALSSDIFVTKLNASGNFAWAKRIGSASSDYGVKIKLDTAGKLYIVGDYTGTTDFDPGPGVFNLNPLSQSRDGFILKLDTAGNFIWAKTIGGTSNDFASSIDFDKFGNSYTIGTFHSTVDFDPGIGTFTISSSNSSGFISKSDPNGNFIWAKAIDGVNGSSSLGNISIDTIGNILLSGSYTGTIDVDPNSGIYNLSSLQNFIDPFIIKLNTSGNFIWAKTFGGIDYDVCNNLSLDNFENIYLSGVFRGGADLDPGPATFSVTSSGPLDEDIFILKLDSLGNFLWGKRIGSNNNDGEINTSITFDAHGDVYFSGFFQDTVDFDPGVAIFNMISAGMDDCYLLKLDTAGNFLWAESMGGPYQDRWAAKIDSYNNIYFTGGFYGTLDVDPGTGTFNLNANSINLHDAFILKLGISTTGIEKDFINNKRIKIYPNPTNKDFTIELNDPSQIIIYNALGQIIYDAKNKNNKTTISLANFENGIYFVEVKSDPGFYTTKIIKSE